MGGPGKSDPDEAFRTYPVNIESKVTAWNDGETNDIETDGQYQLTVDNSTFVFYDEGRVQTMKVYTDYPYGWQVEQSTLPSWLAGKITPDNDNGGATVEVEIEPGDIQLIDPMVAAGDTLNYSFFITAGSIRKEIFIDHINEPELTLELDPEYLYFNKSAVVAKSVEVTTYPDNIPIYFSEVAGDISWRPSGYPNPTEYGGSGLYTFQPAAIETQPAEQRTSSFAVMVISGTKRVTKIIEIIQRATDYAFDVLKQSYYPYDEGNYSFSVDSETDWHVYNVIAATGMVNNYQLNNDYPAGNTDYFFDLSDNHSWHTRTATFQVGSSNIDFAGEDIDIVQNFVSPSLALGSSSIAFGNTTSTTNQSVSVTSNAKWKYSIRDAATWANAVETGSESPAAGTEGGSETFTTTTESNVSFAPKIYSAANGTPAAGTSYTAYADFTTATGGDAPEATGTLTITRSVASWFSFASVSPTSLTKAATSVRVNVNTNNVWSVSSNLSTTASRSTTQAWGSDYLDITIPANETWANRTVTITYSGTNNNTATSGTALSVSQPSHTMGTPSLSSSSIAAAGQTITVTVPQGTTGYPTGYVQVQATASGMTTVSGATNASNQVSLVIPANTGTAARSIVFAYR